MYQTSSVRFLIATLILVLAPAATAALPAIELRMVSDTFEIHMRDMAVHNQFIRTLVDADELEIPTNHGLVVLKRAGSVVAVFPVHQLGLVVNRSLTGGRSFLIRGQGLTETVMADRISSSAPNLQAQTFWVGERVSGMAGPNAFQLIVDEGALIRPGG